MAYKDKEKQREYQRRWNEQHRNEYQRKYRETHERHRTEQEKHARKMQRLSLRQQVFDVLGESCVRCGFSDKRALQIDHVNGGGTIEYRAIKTEGIRRKLLASGGEGYQILCANCNAIKRVENNEDRRRE